MANDRLFIRCPVCDDLVMIAKHFETPWYCPANIEDELNKFFDDHYTCGGRELYQLVNEDDLVKINKAPKQ